ncbi:MAG: M28 family peptidase [Syntrophobacteraceae bacterium]|nr:M28 family peptidase [Syntrophobacteraceae bacterium]
MLSPMAWGDSARAQGHDPLGDLGFFASQGDRSTGSPGAEAAADHILGVFKEAGLQRVGFQKFLVPVPRLESASIESGGQSWSLYPWGPNLVYLPMTPDEGVSGPLIYVADGSFDAMDGKAMEGAIVLMEMASRGNWLHAQMAGARALIYLGGEESTRGDLEGKNTTTPLAFPRYWVPRETADGLRSLAAAGPKRVTVRSKARWEHKLVRNCFGLLEGRHPQLRNELVVLDAFYDSSSHILGVAPGADEATSIATLLGTARALAKSPPDRSVLFVATAGNGQGLAGMRELVSSLTVRRKILRSQSKTLQEEKDLTEAQIDLIERTDPLAQEDPTHRAILWKLTVEKAKDRADALTREIQYQKALKRHDLAKGVPDPRPYRRLSWRAGLEELNGGEKELAGELLREAFPGLALKRDELKLRIEALKSTSSMRSFLDEYRPVLFLSLHLSSRSPHFGLVEMGETYPIRDSVKRVLRATRLSDVLARIGQEVAGETGRSTGFRSIGRGGVGQDSFAKPPTTSHPCCDVAALAGLQAFSLMTLDDHRPYWSTPHDTMDRVSPENIESLGLTLPLMIGKLASHPALESASQPGLKGMASLEGRAMFVRQGELFPDQPAPGTIISVLQGSSIFRTMVYQDGSFFLPGLANSRVSLEKIILEPYGLDPQTGRVAWTADKVQTGKINYRIKVKTDLASTSLVMFRCEQTDVAGTFNPQNMSYLTKVEILDAATEAPPLRYWYSRVDGRDTMAVSVFLEKGTRFKLIMAESLLRKDFFLLNTSPEFPNGSGFLIGSPPSLLMAPYQVARDLHQLLGGRLQNLTRHGIVNVHLESLYRQSAEGLEQARKAMEELRYGAFWESVIESWARLNSVYGEIESTQRDVLTGVMFFIALFVPFAFCVERYLFAFRGVYQQIVAFFLILVVTILIIQGLHPAFQLTYSPMVVIIAFFIVGLSVLVSWILFMRFEREMAEMHSRTAHLKTPQVSKWQSFGAGFSIGVSNLNRRKLRTGLTCLTLIILTFTVMSFTSVKTLHRPAQTRIAEETPYRGILLRHPYRLPLTSLVLEQMSTRFAGEATVSPRGWIEPVERSDRVLARLHGPGGQVPVEGILGLDHGAPKPFRAIVTHGRWMEAGEEDVVLIPRSMAEHVGLDPARDVNRTIRIHGMDLRVVGFFDSTALERLRDLDQQPITPAYLEVSQSDELSEVEIEAMQSGEEVLPLMQRFRYAAAGGTIIIPFSACLRFGGELRAVSIIPHESASPLRIADDLAGWLAYPLFVGEDGTWQHSVSSTLRYQGAATVLIPILIVIFITLNTMIGHVHERQREIGTYTSVGLAPTHVGFLFIVEALSLAVLSTVIGYILAQISAKFLGGTELFSQLTFNYSSLASVACMFLVFSVVFLAALYPARMAAEIAMPDVNRSWTLPEPEGDKIFMNLPFLLKYEEEEGVMGFLSAFYLSYRDTSHGAFIVDEVSLDVDNPPTRASGIPAPVCLLIRTNVWLAPFDFGIKQRIHLHCCPSPDNPGYLEIAIQMIRLSGERSAWTRANHNFIKALRKQMLLWRLLDQEAKASFGRKIPAEAAGQTQGM